MGVAKDPLQTTHSSTNDLQGLVTSTTILGVDHIFMHVVTMHESGRQSHTPVTLNTGKEDLSPKKPSAMNNCY